MFVRSGKSPLKSSVASVSKLGNSLFTAVATSASLNWVSLSISSAKPAGMFVMFVQSGVIVDPSTENVVPVKSSPAPAVYSVLSSVLSAKPAGMLVMFVQSGVIVDPSTENVVPVRSSPAPAVYSVLSSVLSAKPAGTAVRLPHAPSKSSVESVSKFGNSLFTAVATCASLNWVSLSISSAKPAGMFVMFVQSGVIEEPSTENVVPVRSSPAPALYVVSSSPSASPAGMFVRSGKSPLKSSVESVSKLGNSLFTAVATSASLNWVSLSISSAKPAGMFVMFVQSGVIEEPSTEKVVPVRSSPAPAVYVVFVSNWAAIDAKAIVTVAPALSVKIKFVPSSVKVALVVSVSVAAAMAANAIVTVAPSLSMRIKFVPSSVKLAFVVLSSPSAISVGMLVMLAQSGFSSVSLTETSVPVKLIPVPAVYSVFVSTKAAISVKGTRTSFPSLSATTNSLVAISTSKVAFVVFVSVAAAISANETLNSPPSLFIITSSCAPASKTKSVTKTFVSRIAAKLTKEIEKEDPSLSVRIKLFVPESILKFVITVFVSVNVF